jgi:hypothetical protein
MNERIPNSAFITRWTGTFEALCYKKSGNVLLLINRLLQFESFSLYLNTVKSFYREHPRDQLKSVTIQRCSIERVDRWFSVKWRKDIPFLHKGVALYSFTSTTQNFIVSYEILQIFLPLRLSVNVNISLFWFHLENNSIFSHKVHSGPAVVLFRHTMINCIDEVYLVIVNDERKKEVEKKYNIAFAFTLKRYFFIRSDNAHN